MVSYLGPFNDIHLLASGKCVSSVCFQFLFFFKERCFKSQQNPRVDFFKSRKDFEGLSSLLLVVFFFFFIYRSWFFSLMPCLQLPFIIRVEEAVSSTQRFLQETFCPKNEVFLWQTKLKENVWRNSKFQVNRTNTTGKRHLNSSKRAAMSTLQRKNDTTNLSGYKLGELTGNKKKSSTFLLR